MIFLLIVLLVLLSVFLGAGIALESREMIFIGIFTVGCMMGLTFFSISIDEKLNKFPKMNSWNNVMQAQKELSLAQKQYLEAK